ncbi:Spy/CpxP family protein refolding chaperone [Acidithiobacillus sp. M4-SHS-6]|uniref:Spy/CpxP family protein refolding chaperone n=1 Tax=Acidithiobacillus sp. M4-SHS-6 TaxID=3383024 RepID=UPI0039BE3C70
MSKLKYAVSGLMIAALSMATVPAFAEDAPPPPMAGYGPMKGGMMQGCHPGYWRQGPMRGPWMQNMPVPMLMPIVWRNAIDLKLTPAQESDLKNWRNTQRKDFPAWRQGMLAHNKALRQALLNGESGAALAPLKAAVLKDHEMMLDRGIQQVQYLHKILTPVQWQEVVKMAQDKGLRPGPWRK